MAMMCQPKSSRGEGRRGAMTAPKMAMTATRRREYPKSAATARMMPCSACCLANWEASADSIPRSSVRAARYS